MPLANKSTFQLSTFGLIVITCLLPFKATASTSPSIKEFDAEYTAYRFGRDLGFATLSLKEEQNNQFRLEYYSKVSAFFLSDKRAETSLFTIEDAQIIPKTYIYKRTGTGSNKNIGIEFSKQNKQIKVNNGEPIEWQGQFDNQLYRLDAQLQLASGATEFSYDLINNRGDIRHYDLKVVGKEILDLPYGKIEGIKIKLERKSSTRKTLAWFAPKLNYQLVKLQQFKDGDEQGEIRLKKFSFTKEKTPTN
jgi:hypothetical protein